MSYPKPCSNEECFKEVFVYVLIQKKHKKRTRQEIGNGDGPNLMEDHEELEGDNTPGASPRDEKEATVKENDVGGEEKVIYRF